jgi:hypothetical protein
MTSTKDFAGHPAVGLGVEQPQEGRVNTVKALHDQARRDIPVTYDGLSALHVRADFRLHVMITVGRVQARQSMAGNRFSKLTAQHSDWPV